MADSDRTPIDFAALAKALLERADTLVEQWLQGGKKQGYNWMCGGFEGGPGRSLGVNLRTGAWGEFAGDEKGGDLISLYAAIHNLNNGQAARELMRQLGWEPLASSPARVQTPALRAAVGDRRPEPPPEHEAPPGGEAAKPTKRDTIWAPIVPVPRNTPVPTFKHFHRGEPAAVWEYAFDGERYGYVCRYTTSDGGKEILPYTWCEDTSDGRGTRKWQWKQWDAPRPLYVPATLLSDGGALPVVVVEGEKCALAGHQLLGHEFDFVSWPGGGNACDLAQWGWLLGRTVVLWPDVDAKRKKLTKEEREAGVDKATKALLPEAMQPGMKAMVRIGTLLMADHACSVAMCPVPAPGDVADGWDIADAIEQGWDADTVRAFIRGARTFVPPDDAALAKVGHDLANAGGISTASRAAAGSGGGGAADEAAGVGEDERNDAWRKHLLTSDKGSIKAVRENAVLALDGWPERGVEGAQALGGVIGFNEFTNNVEKMKAAPWRSPAGVWEESDELHMGEYLVREHWLPSMPRGTLEEAVLMVARRHAFHPVRARVEACRGKWDGVPRLETWLRRTCLIEDEFDDKDPLQQYLTRAGKWFVMGMCARVLTTVKQGARIVRGPGTKFDFMLIFESPQGWGKSSLAAVLGGEYFADTGLVLGDKDSYQNIQGVWIYEWGELENMSKAEVSKVKLFCSSWKDRFRASYDRRARDYPRQVVFVGTTNESHYLTDPTGNRRFWPVRVTTPPDAVWLAENLEQMFAEALHRLDAGERFWPTREEQIELFDPQQQARTVVNSIDSSIRRYLYDEDQTVPHGGVNGALLSEIGMQDLLARIGFSIEKQTDVVVKRASAVMHALGWPLKRKSNPGRPYVYVRPPSKDEPVVKPRGSDGSTGPMPGQTEEDPDGCPF